MSIIARARALIVAIILFGISGCWLTSTDSEQVLAYPLEVSSSVENKRAPVTWQLAIEVPVARGPIAEDRIVIRDSDGAFSVVAGARWSHRASELIQDAVIRSFEDTGRVPGVVRSSVGSRSDYLLLIEVRAFEASPDQGWSVDVVMSTKLLRMSGMRVVAGRVFRARAPAGSGAAAIVAAFRVATGQVIDELQTWVIHTGEADWKATAPVD